MTSPEATPASIVSPTPYWSSRIMKTPDRKSVTRLRAPKPSATPATPAEASSGARLIWTRRGPSGPRCRGSRTRPPCAARSRSPAERCRRRSALTSSPPSAVPVDGLGRAVHAVYQLGDRPPDHRLAAPPRSPDQQDPQADRQPGGPVLLDPAGGVRGALRGVLERRDPRSVTPRESVTATDRRRAGRRTRTRGNLQSGLRRYGWSAPGGARHSGRGKVTGRAIHHTNGATCAVGAMFEGGPCSPGDEEGVVPGHAHKVWSKTLPVRYPDVVARHQAEERLRCRSSRREPRAAGVQGGIRAACPGPQRVVRATRRRTAPPRARPRPGEQGCLPGGVRRLHAQRDPVMSRTQRGPAQAVRAGPFPGARSADPPGAVRPRRRPVRVLRWPSRPASTTSSRAAVAVSTRWDNVVAACRRCNHVKADRHLAEIGWRLRHQPAPPSGLAWRIIGTGHRDPRWLPYLQPYGADDAMARIDGISA